MNPNQRALALGLVAAAAVVGSVSVINYFDKRYQKKHSARMQQLRAHSQTLLEYNHNLTEFNRELDKAITTAKFWDIVTGEE